MKGRPRSRGSFVPSYVDVTDRPERRLWRRASELTEIQMQILFLLPDDLAPQGDIYAAHPSYAVPGWEMYVSTYVAKSGGMGGDVTEWM